VPVTELSATLINLRIVANNIASAGNFVDIALVDYGKNRFQGFIIAMDIR